MKVSQEDLESTVLSMEQTGIPIFFFIVPFLFIKRQRCGWHSEIILLFHISINESNLHVRPLIEIFFQSKPFDKNLSQATTTTFWLDNFIDFHCKPFHCKPPLDTQCGLFARCLYHITQSIQNFQWQHGTTRMHNLQIVSNKFSAKKLCVETSSRKRHL